jgi:diaminopimelate decarboxylase
MDGFAYRGARLHAEGVDLKLLAERFGTPCFVYSRSILEQGWRAFDEAFAPRPHLVCYAVKANGNLAVLNVLARLGSGFDIVSGGELARVLAAGGTPERIVFSGVGKSDDELREALRVGVGTFNVESGDELERLSALAREARKAAAIALRVNPDVDAKTHPYITTGLRESKFGVPMESALALYERAASLPGIAVSGVAFHLGSQLTEMSPYVQALARVLELIDRLTARGIAIAHLDIGGGLGIRYRDESPPAAGVLAEAVSAALANRRLEIRVEPGRAIVGNAGVLLTRVVCLKHVDSKSFAVVDAAMNDLIRPALYQSWHDVVPVDEPGRGAAPGHRPRLFDVVGPVCETSDFLAKERLLDLKVGDVLAVRSTGAYGFCMSSNYNARPRACEIMVDGRESHLVRARETIESLFAGESTLPARDGSASRLAG